MAITINGTTGIAGVDGSASMPSLQGADTNTGMFFPAADTIAFAEGGAEVMRIDSSGNVGIGTTSPSYKLQASNTNGDTQVGIYDLASGSSAARLDIRTSGTGASQWFIQTGNTASGLNGALRFYDQTITTERMRLDTSGNLQFNSGYGSVATAYGCRAWVNFNGTGTPAIRASGNVTSITDNGTGEYTINFTTAMPDANYATVLGGNWSGTAAITSIAAASPTYSTSAVKVQIVDRNGTAQDISIVCAAIIR